MATIEENFERIATTIRNLSSKIDKLSLSNRGHIVRDVNLTVGASGKSFTSIQNALSMFNGVSSMDCTITVDAGLYTEDINIKWLQNSSYKDLVVLGDQRRFVGLTLVSGFIGNVAGAQGMGTGTVTITSAGSTLTFTATTTNPDFTSAGLVSGDIVIIRDSAGSRYERIVNTVGTNTFTVTVAPGAAVSGNGAWVAFVPNRTIVNATSTGHTVVVEGDGHISFYGFRIRNTAGATDGTSCIFASRTHLLINNCLLENENVGAGNTVYGILSYRSDIYFQYPNRGFLNTNNGVVSVLNMSGSVGTTIGIVISQGFLVGNGAFVNFYYDGQYIGPGSYAICNYSQSAGCTNGYYVYMSKLTMTSASLINETNGILEIQDSFVDATDTNARMITVTNKYPAATGVMFADKCMVIFT